MSRRALTLRLLDRDDPEAVAAYERLFYENFRDLPSQTLIRALWEWDDAAGRIRTRIPYADQRIYTLTNPEGALDLGFAVNLAMHQLQSADYAFAVPADGGRACEILTLFTREKRMLAAWLRLSRTVWADLKGLGFDSVVTTCGPRVLLLHLKLGCEIVDKRQFGDETRYFIRFDLGADPLARYGSDVEDVPVTIE